MTRTRTSRLGFAIALAGVCLVRAGAQAQSGPIDTSCRPRNIVSWSILPRVHVQCEETVAGVRFFAIQARSDNAAEVARVLAILTAARATGSSLVVNFDPADVRNMAALIRRTNIGR